MRARFVTTALTSAPARLALAAGVLGLASAVSFGGCDAEVDYSDPEEAGEAVAEAYCGWISGCCGEEAAPGGSESDCINLFKSNFDLLIQQAESDGYTYDPRCAEQLVDLLSTDACTASALAGSVGDTCEITCFSFAHGDKQKGEACEDPRDCDFGLVCAGTCTDPCGSGIGEPCGAVSDEAYAYCEADLVCDLDIETGIGTCASKPGEGEDCSTNYICDDGLTCLGGTCATPLANGEPCPQYSGCASNYCDTTDPQAPVCAKPPGVGEPCTYLCTPDATCDGTVCVELPGSGEPCPDYQCKPDLYCIDDVCQSLDDASGDICEVLDGD